MNVLRWVVYQRSHPCPQWGKGIAMFQLHFLGFTLSGQCLGHGVHSNCTREKGRGWPQRLPTTSGTTCCLAKWRRPPQSWVHLGSLW